MVKATQSVPCKRSPLYANRDHVDIGAGGELQRPKIGVIYDMRHSQREESPNVFNPASPSSLAMEFWRETHHR